MFSYIILWITIGMMSGLLLYLHQEIEITIEILKGEIK